MRCLLWAGMGLLVLLPLVWEVLGEERHPLLVATRYLPPIAIVAFWALLALVGAKRKPFRIPLAITGILVLAYYSGLALHPTSSKEGVTVLTLNIHAGLAGADKVAAFLKSQSADVIALQEARKPSAAPLPDPVPTIVEQLPSYAMARGGERGELVLLSRLPILATAEHSLADLSTALEVRTRELRILNVHFMTGGDRSQRHWLSASARTRRLQAEAVVQLLEGDTPTIVLGDFNSPPNSTAYRILSRSLTDSHRLGFDLTYPSRFPLWRIDYVWCKDLEPVGSTAVNTGVSDHCAVRATVSSSMNSPESASSPSGQMRKPPPHTPGISQRP